MDVLILGANGFIGAHLAQAILDKTDWQIFAIDLAQYRLTNCLPNKRFQFYFGDITLETDWVSQHIARCDVILPLAAIATPSAYVQNPLRVFELSFEANINIIRQCANLSKRLVFPSTSEVYGMCTDAEFDEEESYLVTGPIHKERWIYASCKQLLDRVIYALGKHHNLDYTLFRPFNWYGPLLDTISNPKPGASRVLTQFMGNILRGEDIQLVNGGNQQRCFTYIDDGISALLKIIENKNNCARRKIFNIGNPAENISIRSLAELLVEIVQNYPQYTDVVSKTKLISVSADHFYGSGYQDISLRVPSVKRAENSLGWKPEVDLRTGLQKTFDFYIT